MRNNADCLDLTSTGAWAKLERICEYLRERTYAKDVFDTPIRGTFGWSDYDQARDAVLYIKDYFWVAK